MATRFPLQVAYQSASTLYAVIRGTIAGVRKVWNPTLNTGAGGWEVFNGSHWAQYAIPVTEEGTSGYYAADYPATIGAVLTSESYYLQAGGGPVLGDTPCAPVSQSQGQNLAAVAGDADVPDTLQQNLVVVKRGAAAGVPTASVIPTDLSSTQANAFAGRSIVFTSGAAMDCAGRIISYAVQHGVVTLAAPLAVAPAAADTFIII